MVPLPLPLPQQGASKSSRKDAVTATQKNRKRTGSSRSPNKLTRMFGILVVISILLFVSVNWLYPTYYVHKNEHRPDHHVSNPKSALSRSMQDFTKLHQELQQKRDQRNGLITPPSMQSRQQQREQQQHQTRNTTNDNVVPKKEPHSAVIRKDAKETKESSQQSLIQQEKQVPAVSGSTTTASTSTLGLLQCDAYGGPSPEIAKEMVYWKDIPQDSNYKSPFHSKRGQQKKYMTFEPDGGGWNNIRMAMETIFALAHAMGRILVMPPEQVMYLLWSNQYKQKHHFGFADFFPIDELAQKSGLEVISMQEFLEREAMTGNLRDRKSGQVSFPPHNRTNWDGQSEPQIKLLKEWLRNVTHVSMWKPGNCIAAFPSTANHSDVVALQEMQQDIYEKEQHKLKYRTTALPVDAPPEQRMLQVMDGRPQLCLYDEEMQNELVVHFMCYYKMRIRYLVYFYQFLFFEDWKQDLWIKRFVRDQLRYKDELQCAAARIIHKLRERSKQSGNANGKFDAFHIRRGDFQFDDTRISAQEIYENSKDELTEGATVYIATDEKNKTFFQPLQQHYNVLFLDDFRDEIQNINTNHFGILDQLVASRADIFFGCWFSTFTSYITRMRGYHSVKDRLEGYQEGLLPTTYYYTLKENKHAMMTYDFSYSFERESPISWRDIDKGIDGALALTTANNMTSKQ